MLPQFEQHLRAILNLPPRRHRDRKSRRDGEMCLVKKVTRAPGLYKGLDDIMKFSGVYVQSLRQVLTKPFRKMGHVTVVDNDILKAKQKQNW